MLARGALLVALLRRAHVAGQGTRTGSIALARPVAGSHVIERALEAHAARAPSRTAPASRCASGGSRARPATPITESCGPVIPTSVSAAVPPGRTRASEVWTWVCVPSTAVTRPSSQAASATFSLVASAWTSTSDDRRRGARLVDELVDDLPHALRGIEEERAEHVDDGDARAVAAGRP